MTFFVRLWREQYPHSTPTTIQYSTYILHSLAKGQVQRKGEKKNKEVE